MRGLQFEIHRLGGDAAMRSMSRRAVALVAIGSLAACAHGGAATPIPSVANGGSTHAGGGPSTNAKIPAGFVFKIPHRNNPAAALRYFGANARHRNYLSPITASIEISATDSNNVNTTVDANLTVDTTAAGANTAECTSTALTTLCTVTVALNPGTYSVDFKTYDNPLDATTGKPQGSVLSLSDGVPFTVTAGGANSLIVSLAGQPEGVEVVPAATERLLRGDQFTGFNLLAQFVRHAIDVYAVDADGDAIIGPGAPTFSEIVSAQKSDLVRVIDATPAAPNRYYVSTIGTLGSGFPQQNRNLPTYVPPALLTFTATPPANSGAVCSPATCERGVFLNSLDTYFAGSDESVQLYAAGESAPFAQSTAVNAVTSASDQVSKIFFSTAASVYEWDPPYDAEPKLMFSLPSSSGNITNLALDGFDNVYVAASGAIYSCAGPSYSNVVIGFGGFIVSSPSPMGSRLLHDSNGNIVVGDGQAVHYFADDFSSLPKTIAVQNATLANDSPDGQLIVFDPTMGHAQLTSYGYDFNSNTYVLNATNPNVSGDIDALRIVGGMLYAPSHSTGQIAAYTLPLGTGAPKLIDAIGITHAEDFEMSGDATGYGAINNDLAGIDENFAISAFNTSRVMTGGTGLGYQALTVVH